MFDKMKEVNELRKMQSEIKKQVIEVEKEGVKVRMTGDMNIKELALNPDLDTDKNAELVQACFNEAIEKLQKNLMSSMFANQ